MNRYRFFLSAVLSLVACGAGAVCDLPSIPASTPTSEFTLNTDGTVTHQKTGLMWMRCALGQSWNGSTCAGNAAGYTWQQALQAAKGLNDAGGYAGRTDWRLPNVKELRSIVERRQCYSPFINSVVFPNTPPGANFWSASTYAYFWKNAWFVSFGGGNVHEYLKESIYQARLVRAGQ